MKVITDYFTPPTQTKNKDHQLTESINSNVLKTSKAGHKISGVAIDVKSDEDEAEYSVRKIKIRLADPNIPDSYICEVYDTSIDDESVLSPINDETSSQKRKHNTRSTSGSLPRKVVVGCLKPRKATLKRRRSFKALTDESSSDEALVSVRKRLKVLKKKRELVGSSIVTRQSSEKENSLQEKVENIPMSSRQPETISICPLPIDTVADKPLVQEGIESTLGGPVKSLVLGDKKIASISTSVARNSTQTPVKSVKLSTLSNKSSNYTMCSTDNQVDNVVKNGPVVTDRTPVKHSETVTTRSKTHVSPVSDHTSSNVKRECIDRWRNSIKEKCLKPSNSNANKRKSILKSVETPNGEVEQRISKRVRALSMPTPAAKNSTQRSSPSIKQYFGISTPASKKSTGEVQTEDTTSELHSIQLRNERSKRNSDRPVPTPTGLKTPVKECSVVLKKTPIKVNTDSPTKDCKIVLEKISQEKVTELSNIQMKKVNLAPLFLNCSKKRTGSLAFVEPSTTNLPNKVKGGLNLRQTISKSGAHMKNTRQPENVAHSYFYPVHHIQQRANEAEWSTRVIDLKLSTAINSSSAFSPLVWQPMQTQRTNPLLARARSQLPSLEDTIGNLKETYKNVMIDNICQFLKERHEEFLDTSQQILPVWSEKYKPDCESMLSNEKTVMKLSKWLASWKLYNEEIRDGGIRRRRRESNYSSADEFISSDDDVQSSRRPITACLIHGPASSGKTSLIYSLADQLDLNILEVNASTKRSGKRMLSDLQEATKSHKILQASSGNMSRSGDKMSVIVVEEADIVFDEQDEGFVSGLQTLISSAKRPVVILTSDVTASHLDKFRTSQTLQLNMMRPNLSVASAILEIVCVLEGASPSRSSILRVLNKNRCDLRRSLLELQFWMDGTSDATHTWPLLTALPLSSTRLWWASHQSIFKRELWHAPSSANSNDDTSKHIDQTSEAVQSSDDKAFFRNFEYYADCLSVCDIISSPSSEGCELNKRAVVFKDSVSLVECRLSDNEQQKSLRFEIANEAAECIARSAFSKQTANYKLLSRISEKEARWLSARRKASDELLVVVPGQNLSITSVEYLPALREMCRSEKKRGSFNTKRRNRFYHYLRTLGATPTQVNLDINCRTLNRDCSSR